MKNRQWYLLNIMFALFVSAAQAQGGQFFSGLFCQPNRNGGAPEVTSFNQDSGSIIAAHNNVRVHCPLSGTNLNGILKVRVYAAAATTASDPSVINCRVYKMSSTGVVSPGMNKYRNGPFETAVLDLFSVVGEINTISANVSCTLNEGVSILAYYLYQ